MIQVEFIFQSNKYSNQYKKEESMKVICQNFISKIGKKLEDYQFLYNGQSINFQLTFNEQANKLDKIQGKMIILVNPCENEGDIKKEIKSKEIICPKCQELSLINVDNYTITIFDCKNSHKVDSIHFKQYEDYQKIDESKIVCDNCKDTNKYESYQHTFYKCLFCKQNLCPLCKSQHNKEHEIINFDEKNYICEEHNEKFNSYCNNCKKNLCLICESEHQDLENIIEFKNIIKKYDAFNSQIEVLKQEIKNLKKKTLEIINMVNTINENLDIYYNINLNLINIYKKFRNYQLLKNVNNIFNSNNLILNDINKITNSNKLIDVLNNSLDLYNKMKSNYQFDINNNNNPNCICSNNIGNKLEDFEILQVLSEGSYGFIAKVKSKLNSEIYFLKKTITRKMDETEKIIIRKEMIFSKKLNHQNIFKYLGKFEANGDDYYLSEFFRENDLFKLLADNANLNLRIKEEFLWHIFLQCLEGLKYLHNQGIIHRDIKLGNIYIDDKDNIQIGNFEIASVINKNQIKYFTDDPQMQKELRLNFEEIIGTENYMAPEVENKQHYDQKADVYSLGICFYCLCYYNLPYINGNNMNELMNDNLYSDELKEIICKMIQKDPKIRPTSNEIYTKFKNLYIQKYGNNS